MSSLRFRIAGTVCAAALAAAGTLAVGPSGVSGASGAAASGHTVPTWHPEAVPAPVGANTDPFTEFAGLSCPSDNTCVAIGSYKSGTRTLPLVAIGTGLGKGGSGVWTTTPAPVPAGAASAPREVLESVSCLSPTFCVAVGSYFDARGNLQAVVVSGFASVWTASEVVLPGDAVTKGQKAHLTGVDCIRGDTCAATGQYMAGRAPRGMLLIGKGPHWHARPLSDAFGGDDPASITCTRGMDCAAIATTFGPEALILGDHGVWTQSTVMAPSKGHAPFVSAVACPAPGSCVAVGTYFDAKGAEGLIESQSGSSFVPVEAPLPADASKTVPNGTLTGIACATPTNCTAVGTYSDTSGVFEGMILVGSGTSWQAVTAPLPSGGDTSIDSNMFNVACEASGNCVAWGNYVTSGGEGEVMLLSESGSSWESIRAPWPLGGQRSMAVSAVSFVAGTAVAVGYYSANNKTEGMAEVA